MLNFSRGQVSYCTYQCVWVSQILTFFLKNQIVSLRDCGLNNVFFLIYWYKLDLIIVHLENEELEHKL